MIKELVCCILDSRHRVLEIQQKVELLELLPFLKEPIERSLEVSVYKPAQALQAHATSFILPYMVTNYLDQCLGYHS